MNRRSFIRTLPALAALAAVPALGFARTSRASEGIVTASALNVRTGPGAYNPAVGVVYGGTRVTIHDEAHGWYRISAHRISGWASASYIRPVGGYDYSHDNPRRDDDRDYGRHDYDDRDRDRGRGRDRQRQFAVVGHNHWGYANMFDGPGRRYQVIARLDAGERVRVIEPGRRWTLVGKRGVGRGYIRSRFLEHYR